MKMKMIKSRYHKESSPYGICLFIMYLLSALSLFQDHKFIRKTFHTDTTANLKAALFHPIPLYDKLRHIFTAVYRSRISFHPVAIPPAL